MKKKILSAKNEGRAAGYLKKGRHTNPYGGGPRHAAWLEGYAEGFENLCREQEEEQRVNNNA